MCHSSSQKAAWHCHMRGMDPEDGQEKEFSNGLYPERTLRMTNQRMV